MMMILQILQEVCDPQVKNHVARLSLFFGKLANNFLEFEVVKNHWSIKHEDVQPIEPDTLQVSQFTLEESVERSRMTEMSLASREC